MNVDFHADYWTYADISILCDVPVNTLRVWRVRGKLPAPDLIPNTQTPLWKPQTIVDWNKARDGSKV